MNSELIQIELKKEEYPFVMFFLGILRANLATQKEPIFKKISENDLWDLYE